jgi:hypothetical protein
MTKSQAANIIYNILTFDGVNSWNKININNKWFIICI